MAETMAESMFVPGSIYSKCGVMLEGLHRASEAQIDLFAAVDPKAAPLLAAIDGLNGRFGRNTVRVAAAGQGDRPYDTKRERKSPSWTTRIAEIPIAR
jgi:DNA polymerase V